MDLVPQKQPIIRKSILVVVLIFVIPLLGFVAYNSISTRSNPATFDYTRPDFSLSITHPYQYDVAPTIYLEKDRRDGDIIEVKDRFCITWDRNPNPMYINFSIDKDNVYWTNSIDDYVKRMESIAPVIKPLPIRKISGRDFYVVEQKDTTSGNIISIGPNGETQSEGTATFQHPTNYVHFEGNTMMRIEVQKTYCNNKPADTVAINNMIDSIVMTGDLSKSFFPFTDAQKCSSIDYLPSNNSTCTDPTHPYLVCGNSKCSSVPR